VPGDLGPERLNSHYKQVSFAPKEGNSRDIQGSFAPGPLAPVYLAPEAGNS